MKSVESSAACKGAVTAVRGRRPRRSTAMATVMAAGLVAGIAGLADYDALERTGLSPISAAVAAQAADPTTFGRDLAGSCSGCHNTGGRAIGQGVPIAGMPAERMVQIMTDFRDGKRVATVMHQIAKGYTPEQIRLIADWFSTQPTK